MSISSPVVAGHVAPRRTVPASIARPVYVDRDAPEQYTGSDVQNADTIERMRHAGRVAARAAVDRRP